MSGDDSGSSGSSGEYTTDDLIGKWTSNDTGEGFRENIFTFLNATQVEVYDGSTTETMNYTLSGSSITIDGQPDYVKSMTLISKTQFTMKVYMYDIWWTGTYTKQSSSSSSSSGSSSSSDSTETTIITPTTDSEYKTAAQQTIDDIVAKINALTADGTVKAKGYLLEEISSEDAPGDNYGYDTKTIYDVQISYTTSTGYYNFKTISISDALSSCKYKVTLDLSDVQIVPWDASTGKVSSDNEQIYFPDAELWKRNGGSQALYTGYSIYSDTTPRNIVNSSAVVGLYLPDNVTTVCQLSNDGSKNLETLKLPSSATRIAEKAFLKLTALESIEIPSNVTTIDADAFSYCSSLKTLTIPSKVTSLGYSHAYPDSDVSYDSIFSSSGSDGNPDNLESLTIGCEEVNLVGIVGNYYYRSILSKLASVTFTSDVKKIYSSNSDCFGISSNLTEVNFEDVNGWKLTYVDSVEYSNGEKSENLKTIDLSSIIDVSDKAKAAEFFKQIYYSRVEIDGKNYEVKYLSKE